MLRRRYRWRPSPVDFTTWAVSAVWETAGRLMTGLHAVRAWARARRRSTTPVWPGSRPA
jgi:hypothetical protein